jgi:hypothetical protein
VSFCIASAAGLLVLAARDFTLSWTHSVERTEWVEQWRVGTDGLTLREARIRGSGAGMEPPEGARLTGGWWVYVPALPPQPSVTLAASGATGAGWTLCAAGTCRTLGSAPDSPITLSACDDPAG